VRPPFALRVAMLLTAVLLLVLMPRSGTWFLLPSAFARSPASTARQWLVGYQWARVSPSRIMKQCSPCFSLITKL